MKATLEGSSPVASGASLRKWRILVLALAMAALTVKLYVAWVTNGTNDVVHWIDFAHGVRISGPVGVYAYPFTHSLYNHPPLIGYFLVLVNWLAHAGVPIKFTIRAAASLADVASAVLVFEILRRRRSLREATWAAVLVALSPVLFVVSGFHGNTDPIFAMFILLSLLLLADYRMPAAAGGALAVALSIKIVPLVVAPTLLVYAAHRDRRTLVRFCFGFAPIFLLIWGPALLREWGPLRRQVLDYTGSSMRPWGLPQFATWIGRPSAGPWLAGSGRLVVVGLCALVPTLLLWRRPRLVAEAAGLAVAGFLLLSPAFATQYLVWPLAFCYLVDFWAASAYNLLAGAFMLKVYSRWSGGTLLWDTARGSPLTLHERLGAVVVWVSLAVVVGRAVWIFRPQAGAAGRDISPVTKAVGGQ